MAKEAAAATAASAVVGSHISEAAAEEISENNDEEDDRLEGQMSLEDIGIEPEEDSYDDEYQDDGFDDYDDDGEYDDDEEFEDEEPEIKVELAKNIKLPKSSVGFEKYSKKLKLNSENDDYDDDYDDDLDDYDDDFDDYFKEFDEEKRQEKKVTIAAVITAFAIIGVIVFVGIKFFNVFDNAAAVFNKSKTVPNFVGMTLTDAEADAEKLGITLVQGAVVDSIEPQDTILTQDIDEGVSITDKMEIIVTVSSGANVYSMPNVVGEEESLAIAKITSSELNANIIIEYEYDESHPEGTVIKQSPEGDSQVTESVEVVLTICRDQDSLNAVVPNVVGLSETDAKNKITSSGLTVGNVSYTTSSSVAKGYVITQTANPGEEILKNSSIDIVVSSGRPAAPPTNNSSNTQNNNSNTIGSNTNSNTNSGSNSTQEPAGTDNTDDVPVIGSME